MSEFTPVLSRDQLLCVRHISKTFSDKSVKKVNRGCWLIFESKGSLEIHQVRCERKKVRADFPAILSFTD